MTAFAALTNDSSSLRWGKPFALAREEQRHAPVVLHVDASTRSEWVPVVVSRLKELAALPADPRGSDPMNLDDLHEALMFIGAVMRSDTVAPWIGRLSTGGLQVNWRCGDVEVEAVFDHARDDHVVYVTVGDLEWEERSDRAYSLFATVVDRLSSGAPADA